MKVRSFRMAGNMNLRLAAAAVALPVAVFGLAACSGLQGGQAEVYSESFFAMDTYMTFTIYGANADTALKQAEGQIKELEGLWSVTDTGSDIYAANHSGGEPVVVDEKTFELIDFVLDMAEETGGALEPTIYPVLSAWGFTTGENREPSAQEIAELLKSVGYEKVQMEGGSVCLEEGCMLDLGSVGKGFAGDEVVQVLKESGIESALLDIGGNIQAVGTRPDGSGWRVGLKDPFSGGVLGVIKISEEAVVTSGSYERYFIGADGKRYGHIIDPATGYPVDNGLASVSVIAGEGKLCDALSTALFVMGLEGAKDYWQQNQDFDMILITEDGSIYITEGIKDRFSLQEEYRNMLVNVIEGMTISES